MTVTKVTSGQFVKDIGEAKKAARRGPVFIADRGQPAYVLLTIEEYHRLRGGGISLAAALAQPGENDFAFNPPRFGGTIGPAELG